MVLRKVFVTVLMFILALSPSTASLLFADAGGEVANVNGVSISTAQFEKRMSRLTGEGQGNFNTFEGKKELLDIMVAREVLNQEGKRLGLNKIKAVLDRIEEIEKELVINEVVNQIAKEKVTPSGMKAYYSKNRADFREVHANHILLATEEEAKEAKKKLDGGADFATLAKEVSKDPASKERGGDLGFFTKDRMVKPFSDAAFAMKNDEIRGPVQSAFGFHIIKVVESRDPKKFDELSQAQLQNLRGVMINWEIEQLKKKAKIKVDEETLRKAASGEGPSHSGDGHSH
ncbi:MAG: peptidylprolyl isomerase [Nitrospiria bacterium]